MLNFHHLRLFRAVAREGNLTRASRTLGLTPQTVSAQIRELEGALNEELFHRRGRRLELSEAGRIALRYADEIFALGREFEETLRGQPTGKGPQLVVGVTEALPKLIVHHLLQPAMELPEPAHLICKEGSCDALLGGLATHSLDVVLADFPLPHGSSVKAYNHPLGSCAVTFMAPPTLAAALKAGFPRSLDGAPMILPTSDAVLRGQLDRWLERNDLHPKIVAEFQDSALLKSFGQGGAGVFAIAGVVAQEVARQYEVEAIGSSSDLQESFFAWSVERRVRHPGVAAICDKARHHLFCAEGGDAS